MRKGEKLWKKEKQLIMEDVLLRGQDLEPTSADTFTRRNYMYPGTVRFEKGSYIVTFEFSQQEFWKFKNQFK